MKIFIGFSVDMDRAYSDFNCHGQKISKNHKDYEKNQNYKNEFIELTNKLIDYFNTNNYNKSVTWYVNEADYHISSYYKSILQKCSRYGEIGLHTHLNSKKFNAEHYNMSKDRKDWERLGIKDANSSINEFIDYNNFIYKAGNHIRCNELYDCLSDNNFSIDTTMDINNKNFENGYLFYDDTNILLGTEPFFIKCDNGNVILEIPEIRVSKVMQHIKECEISDKLCFIKLQIHHWQYDELIPQFDSLIERIRNLNYELEFIDLRQMQNIFFKKIQDKLESKIQNNIKTKLINDEYYLSLKKCIGNDFLLLSTWLFNFYDKRSNIIELFAGIGQCSLFLHELGFSNLTISDFNNKRCNFHKEISNYKNIVTLVSDFYDVELNNYDICFFGNSINSSLCHKLDIQVQKYQEFINNNKLLIIHSKYGSGIKEFNYLLENLKNYSVIKQIGDYFAIKKNNSNHKIIPFSTQFKLYKTISFSNIEDKIINIESQEFIKLKFLENIKSSSGIYFPLSYIYPDLEEKIYKCKLIFDVKINKVNNESKIKIYTGIKWVILDNKLTEDYQTIEFIDDFNFFKASTYRIGFVNMENNSLYFKNILLNI